MNRADITTLVEQLAVVPISADTIASYFNESLYSIGKWPRPPIQSVEMIELTSGTATYSIPDSAIRILHAFHASRYLSPCSVSDLEAYDYAWRTLSDDPYFITIEEDTPREFTLIPNPDASSGKFSFPNASPFGEDFPTNTCTLIYSEFRETDFPEWIAIYIALNILSREFAHPSDHQDLEFAAACTQASRLFMEAAGL